MGKTLLVVFIAVFVLAAVYFHIRTQLKGATKEEIAECEAKLPIEKANCYTILAAKKENYVICKRIELQSLKDNCFVLLSRITGRKIICNRVHDRKTAIVCFDFFSKQNKTVEDYRAGLINESMLGGEHGGQEGQEPGESSSGSAGKCNWNCQEWTVCSNSIQMRECSYNEFCKGDEAQQVRSCE